MKIYAGDKEIFKFAPLFVQKSIIQSDKKIFNNMWYRHVEILNYLQKYALLDL